MSADKTIIRTRKNRENPYVMIDKFGLNDERLSWKAKGLLAYLLSKPDDWTIRINDLIKRSKDGRDAVKAGLRELELYGYLSRHQHRDETGKFGDIEYIIYERPQLLDTKGVIPQTENPSADSTTVNGKSVSGKTVNGKPANGKSTPTNKRKQLKNNSTNNELTNNNKNKIEENNVVVDLLTQNGVKVNKPTLTKWSKLADEQTILAAIKEALGRSGVKTVVGYVTRMLEQGYTPSVPGSASNPKGGVPDYIVKQLEAGYQETAATIDPAKQKEALDLLLQLGEINQSQYDKAIESLQDTLDDVE